MKFLLGYNMKIVIYGGGGKNLEGESTGGGFFHVGRLMANFWLAGGTPPILPVGKTLLCVCKTEKQK